MKDQRLYLSDIQVAGNKIRRYTKAGKDDFLDSTLIQDAVMRNFEIIGEAAKRLSVELCEKYPQIPWKNIKGFRDVLIHDYDGVDLDQVWLSVEQNLPSLLKVVNQMIKDLDS